MNDPRHASDFGRRAARAFAHAALAASMTVSIASSCIAPADLDNDDNHNESIDGMGGATSGATISCFVGVCQ